MGQFEAKEGPPIYTGMGNIRDAFEALPKTKVNLPQGEPAFWTLPRVTHQWRLPGDDASSENSDLILPLPMRKNENAVSSYLLEKRLDGRGTHFVHEGSVTGLGDHGDRIPDPTAHRENAYLNMIPQPMIMHSLIGKAIEEKALQTLPHFAHEDSLARREYAQSMLIFRGDVIVEKEGNVHVQVGEFDDACSLWSLSSEYNPIVESYIYALEDQMGLPIRTVELFEGKKDEVIKEQTSTVIYTAPNGKKHIMDTSGFATIRREPYHYFHSEDWWGSFGPPEELSLDEVALVIRARKNSPDFEKVMDYYGHRSITMAWNRDSRRPLAAANLGILAANLEDALAFGNTYLGEKEHEHERLVYKADGARTETTAIHTVRTGKHAKHPGESSANQIRAKFARASYDGSPVLIQPFLTPPTLIDSGVVFLDGDRERIRSQEGVREDAGEYVTPGNEHRYSMIFRTFSVYLPNEQRFAHIGGLWQASPGYIVHGGSHSVAGPLYVDGVIGHPAVKKYGSLVSAEKMVRKNCLSK